MSDSAPSPFLAQYLEIKARHGDALLFFRMGDFYELFFDDAVSASAALGITLTARGQHEGASIPMAGVPWHQAETHLAKLIRHGFRVAVCEQLEDPAEAKKRGHKAVVRRDVVRIVTPGTLTEEALLEPQARAWLAAVRVGRGRAGIARADVATGVVETWDLPAGQLHEVLGEGCAEILALSEDASLPELAGFPNLVIRPAVQADPKTAARAALSVFEVASLDAFGAFSPLELSALGLVLEYLALTQAGAAPKLAFPRRREALSFMAIDPATRAALEIERSSRGTREGSLLACIDRTRTAAGARLLAERLARPLLERAAIAARHDAIAWFIDRPERREAVRAALATAPDLARAAQRLALARGGPRDLDAVRRALAAGERVAAMTTGPEDAVPDEIAQAVHALTQPDRPELAALGADLGRALVDSPGPLARDGGFIAQGYDPALDAARALRDDSRQVIASLQAEYAEKTNLPLKIKHNAVLGYHLETTPRHAESLLASTHANAFRHRQTTANSVRFTTDALAELDARIARAGEEALARELTLFEGFAARVAGLAEPLRAFADGLAVVDVATAGAHWAVEVDATRPEIEPGAAFVAEGARHPVVEAALAKTGARFTPNDLRLDGEGRLGPRLLLITGANMAGKSTYLRQTALLAILAQAGGYVPARRLKLGLADRVFSRVGASDDLARGRSTFMTEMIETAAILNQATPQSLVILDEIGRGTATYDGLAIAWAAAEHLHETNRCRALFATHYHELTGLSERLAACANAHLKAREWKGDLVFLHEVAPGPADRSYGVQAARLAGVPKAVVERARAILARLEAGKGGKGAGLVEALPLFSELPVRGEPSATEAALAALDPDAMSPKEALEALYRLKAMLDRPDGERL